MKNSTSILAAATIAALAVGEGANAASTMHFNASQSYTGLSSSPFASQAGFFVENFEHGAVNTNGFSIKGGGFVQGPGSTTNSVDDDDGKLNGKGTKGYSYTSGDATSLTIKFDSQNGNVPKMAGLVWTDGDPNSKITFKAWASDGTLIGKVKATLGDTTRYRTGDDRFFGAADDRGIAKLKITSNYKGFQIDHVQYAYSLAVVPLPASALLGLSGLACVGVVHGYRRMRSKSAHA